MHHLKYFNAATGHFDPSHKKVGWNSCRKKEEYAETCFSFEAV